MQQRGKIKVIKGIFQEPDRKQRGIYHQKEHKAERTSNLGVRPSDGVQLWCSFLFSLFSFLFSHSSFLFSPAPCAADPVKMREATGKGNGNAGSDTSGFGATS